MDKWDDIKVKSFSTTKEIVSKLKRPLTECQLYIKGLITRIYRELKKLNSLSINEPIKNNKIRDKGKIVSAGDRGGGGRGR
jgi:hypothetical protein